MVRKCLLRTSPPDHRVAAIVRKDVKPLLLGRATGKNCLRHYDGQERPTKRYDIRMSVRPQLLGPDLVLTWIWLGNLIKGPGKRPKRYVGGTLELVRQEINIAASFEIEEVDIQIGDVDDLDYDEPDV